MPIIRFDGPQLPKEKKAELVEKITKVAQEVLPSVPVEAFTVVVNEHSMDNIAVGGTLLADRKS